MNRDEHWITKLLDKKRHAQLRVCKHSFWPHLSIFNSFNLVINELWKPWKKGRTLNGLTMIIIVSKEEDDDVDGKTDYSCLWYNCTSMRSWWYIAPVGIIGGAPEGVVGTGHDTVWCHTTHCLMTCGTSIMSSYFIYMYVRCIALGLIATDKFLTVRFSFHYQRHSEKCLIILTSLIWGCPIIIAFHQTNISSQYTNLSIILCEPTQRLYIFKSICFYWYIHSRWERNV